MHTNTEGPALASLACLSPNCTLRRLSDISTCLIWLVYSRHLLNTQQRAGLPHAGHLLLRRSIGPCTRQASLPWLPPGRRTQTPDAEVSLAYGKPNLFTYCPLIHSSRFPSPKTFRSQSSESPTATFGRSKKTDTEGTTIQTS